MLLSFESDKSLIKIDEKKWKWTRKGFSKHALSPARNHKFPFPRVFPAVENCLIFLFRRRLHRWVHEREGFMFARSRNVVSVEALCTCARFKENSINYLRCEPWPVLSCFRSACRVVAGGKENLTSPVNDLSTVFFFISSVLDGWEVSSTASIIGRGGNRAVNGRFRHKLLHQNHVRVQSIVGLPPNSFPRWIIFPSGSSLAK